jgi:chromosome segregation ATPase
LEIARFKREIHDLKKILQQIELERDMYIKEAAVLQGEVVDSLGLIKKKEIQIYEYKKQMVQADTKLKHQQALYEAVQSDRNLHAKHLLENQSEIAEMKRKLKIMNYQINGYKEDINGKDEYLSKEKQENTRLLRDIKDINDETDNLKNQNDIAQAYIKTQLAEEMKLNQFVKEAELERNRQENAWQILISERDNLCNQLMKQYLWLLIRFIGTMNLQKSMARLNQTPLR